MKNLVNWKLFFLLLAASIVVSFMVIPYAFALSPGMAEAFTPITIFAQIAQNLVLFSLAIFVGLLLYRRIGFKMPFLEGLFEGKSDIAFLKSILPVSAGLGAVSGILVILLSLPFGVLSLDLLGAENQVAVWKVLFASFYGGIGEEILMRFFLVSLLVWVTWKIKKAKDGTPTRFGIWLSIILVSVIFGLGHLPITGTLTEITPIVVLRAVLLNGVCGLVFGWLYWKRGLESAIIAHFTADIVLHIITPNVARFFV